MTFEERGYIADAIKDVIEFNVKKERDRIVKIIEEWGKEGRLLVGPIIHEIRRVEE